MKLVASAIVANEANRYLGTWLHHLLTFCDEVRILDDGSTDGTREICEQTEGVEVATNHAPRFFQDESEARNALLRWTMQGEPDYVLAIDADEFIGDTDKLRDRMRGGAGVYSLTMREVWKIRDAEIGLRVDGLWGPRRCPILWRSPGVLRGSRWQIPRRKLACGREPIAVRGQRGADTGVSVYHFGWTRERDRVRRAARYAEHDGGKFHADRHLQSILDPDKDVTLDWQPWPFSIPADVAADAV